jgi:UDP-GlcNAc:undecaprenyl-phosphate GlcNAc-1-phosphate transferase
MDWLTIGPLLGTFAIPLAVSLLLISCHIRVARDFGLTDHPDPRKVHKNPTPTGAGIAMYLALILVAFSTPMWSSQFLVAGLIVLLGLVDDWRPLPWYVRLPFQALAAWAGVFMAVRTASPLWCTLGAGWVVVLINAMNFMDNMDGACAGVGWIITAGLACLRAGVLGQAYADFSEPYRIADSLGFFQLLAFLGVLSGFLWFNRPPARVFMGDSGSTFIGFFLGIASGPLIFGAGGGKHIGSDFLAPLCIFALPLYDLVSVAFLRIWHKRGLFVSDKNNLSHRLVNLGLSQVYAVLLICFLAVVGCVGGLLLYLLADPLRTIVGISQLTAWWVGLPLVEYIAHRRMVGGGQ